MHLPLIVVGLLLTASGGVFVLQGLGIAFHERSFMGNDPTWAAIGAVTAAVGVVLAARGARRR